jgi:competence protein ComEA
MTKIFLGFIVFFLFAGMALAAVDLNSADEQALGSLKGVGPAKARAIVAERKNGPFRSLDDVGSRVKGIGPRMVAQWKKDGSASTLDAAAQPDAGSGTKK